MTKKQILIIDDEPHMIELMKEILEIENYNVTYANNGLDALEDLNSNIPDLIISDIMMPGMQGYELVSSIKENPKTKNIPILLSTVLCSSEINSDFTKNKEIKIISKPFNNNSFLSIVKEFFLTP